MGMVGGGQGAFIGGVHRMVAALDQQIEMVAGCFSRDADNTRTTGEQLHLDPARCYATYDEMAAAEAALPADQRIDFVSVVTPNVSHFAIAKTFLEAGFHVVCDKPMTSVKQNNWPASWKNRAWCLPSPTTIRAIPLFGTRDNCSNLASWVRFER